jgi:hypothetical protein
MDMNCVLCEAITEVLDIVYIYILAIAIIDRRVTENHDKSPRVWRNFDIRYKSKQEENREYYEK